MNENSKIYIAGHRGLVGSAILRKLRTEGYRDLVVRTHEELDLTDQGAVNVFFQEEQPEYVFTAAARVGGILANDTRPGDFIRENLAIQTNVIDAAYRNGTRKLMFLGSSCIYPKMAPQPIREEHLLSGRLEPTNEWYALAKIAGIKMCQAYRKQFDFNAICLMPCNLYGPGDNFDLETSHVLPALMRKFHLAKLAMRADLEGLAKDEERYGPIPEDYAKILAAEAAGSAEVFCGKTGLCGEPSGRTFWHLPVVIWGTGAPRREFLHVDDLAEACLFLMLHYDSGDIINVGTGVDLTIRDLAETVAQTVGFEGVFEFDATHPDGTPRKLLDVSRIHSLGWRPKIGLREGIEMTYTSYCEESDAVWKEQSAA